MLKFSVKRQPLSEHSYSARKSFDATLTVDHNGPPNYEERWLRLGFCDESNGHLYASAIMPRDFGEVARLMVEADPVAAVRAFGVALQHAAVEREGRPHPDEAPA